METLVLFIFISIGQILLTGYFEKISPQRGLESARLCWAKLPISLVFPFGALITPSEAVLPLTAVQFCLPDPGPWGSQYSLQSSIQATFLCPLGKVQPGDTGKVLFSPHSQVTFFLLEKGESAYGKRRKTPFWYFCHSGKNNFHMLASSLYVVGSKREVWRQTRCSGSESHGFRCARSKCSSSR